MNSDALRRLIDTVEAGERPAKLSWDLFDHSLDAQDNISLIFRAFDGDLNATKTLHDTLLPGATWQISNGDGAYIWLRGSETTDEFAPVRGDYPPARAWLLAILKAKQAEIRNSGAK